jgi:hypothetical protein
MLCYKDIINSNKVTKEIKVNLPKDLDFSKLTTIEFNNKDNIVNTEQTIKEVYKTILENLFITLSAVIEGD